MASRAKGEVGGGGDGGPGVSYEVWVVGWKESGVSRVKVFNTFTEAEAVRDVLAKKGRDACLWNPAAESR